MEPQRFDGLTRTWATGSRRRMLAGMAATALAALSPRRAGAACTPETCDAQFACGERFCATQCETIFEPAGTVCRPAVDECDVEEVCTGASLNCPTDQKRTNGSACSSDGNSCTNDICQNGTCTHVPNSAPCADDGNICTDDICAGGACTHPPKADTTPCPDDGNPCTDDICLSGACRHQLKADGTLCPDGVCRSGECVPIAPVGACGGVTCAPGQLCCGGACIDSNRNRFHCGQCEKRCRSGRCRNGRCRRRRKNKSKNKNRR